MCLQPQSANPLSHQLLRQQVGWLQRAPNLLLRASSEARSPEPQARSRKNEESVRSTPIDRVWSDCRLYVRDPARPGERLHDRLPSGQFR